MSGAIKGQEQYFETDIELCNLYFQMGEEPSFLTPFPLSEEIYNEIKNKYISKDESAD